MKRWSDQDVTWHGLDGTLYWFHLEGGEYVTYAGGQRQHYPQLTYYSDGDQVESRYYVMEWPDQLRYRFSNDGKFWMIQDRNMNETFFEWIKWPTYHGYDYRIESVTDSAGHRVEFQYSPDTGNVYSTVIKEIDGAGNQAGTVKKFYFMYNQEGQFVGYREPSQKIVRFVYDDLYRIKKVIDNGNNVRESEGEIAESVVTHWNYDENNRMTSIEMTRKQDNTREFLDVTYADSQAEVTSPRGSYSVKWNPAERLTERTEKVVTLNGVKNAITSYVYSRNELIEEKDPLGRTSKYRHTDKGLIAAELAPNGLIKEYEYDSEGDLVRELGSGSYVVSYAYAKDLRKILSRTKTVTISDPSALVPTRTVTTREEFLDNGMLAKEVDGEGNEFVYTYDDNYYVTSEGRNIAYTYDQNGNKKTETRDPGTDDEATTTYEYNPVGLLLHSESPTGLVEEFEHDDFGRVETHVQTDKNDPEKKLVRSYTYNDGGYVTEQDDRLTKTAFIGTASDVYCGKRRCRWKRDQQASSSGRSRTIRVIR